MTDMDGILQIQMLEDGAGVGRVMVHVVPVADLGRTTMAAAVRGDDAIALLEEVEHLRIPIVGRERPAMMKHDGLGILWDPSPCNKFPCRPWSIIVLMANILCLADKRLKMLSELPACRQ